VTLVFPPATRTLVGTVALEFADVNPTIIPPVGAVPLRVTVPVAEVPPVTDVGETVNVDNDGGVTVSVVVTDAEPMEAVIVALTFVAVGDDVMVNVAEVAPAAIKTVAGVTAFALLEESVTVDPPVGTAPFNVTVPVDELPPTTEAGETARLDGTGGTTVNVAINDVW
jgi:hypothetical protein